LFIASVLSLMRYNNKLANVVSAILFFIPTIAIFILPIYAKTLGNMIIGSTYATGLAWGAIVCGVIAFACVILNIAILILNKKLDLEVPVEEPAKEEQPVEENKEN